MGAQLMEQRTNQAVSIDRMLKWMMERKGKVTYDMHWERRKGPHSYDCSSAVYNALWHGGFLNPTSNPGNTDSLFNDLEKNGWERLPEVNGHITARRGDIFIWGKRGASAGSAGHTGIFTDNSDTIIHCNIGRNGISIDNHDVIWNYAKLPVAIYRFKGQGSQSSNLIPYSGIFYPDFSLPVSNDTLPSSPAVGWYQAGNKIYYDGYIIENGYVWISYVNKHGIRRYIAVGPDDGRTDTVWGTGFLNNSSSGGGSLISYAGTFSPSIALPVSKDTLPSSPAVGWYQAGDKIHYDSYIAANGYVWISYISYSGMRRYVAVGPDDGRKDTVWGTGF